jgi:hypothetical protein
MRVLNKATIHLGKIPSIVIELIITIDNAGISNS